VAPRVSILIASLNTRELLRDCLRSLRAVAYQPRETIVVDNGSSDGTAAMVRDEFPEVQLIALPANLGFVGANLRAYAQASGAYVCFLNSDTRVEPDFLTHLVAFMEACPDAGGCEPKILWMRDPSRLDSVGDYLTWTGLLHHEGYLAPEQTLTEAKPIFAAKGACMLFRQSVLRLVGLFDEAYFAYFEETDLCWRVWLSGHKVYVVPAARILHLLAGTSRHTDSYLVTYHSFKNRIHSMAKNFGAAQLWRVMPVHLAICASLMLVYAARMRRAKARAIRDAVWWNVRTLPRTWRQRRSVQRDLRSVPDRVLMRVAMAKVPLRYFWSLYREYERV